MLPPPRRPHQLSEERRDPREQQQQKPDAPATTAAFARPHSRFAADPAADPAAGAGRTQPDGRGGGERGAFFSPTAASANAASANANATATATAAANANATTNPRCWRDYWDERMRVPVPERRATFNVYAAGPRDAPACFLCLHGGGYTGATWSLVARALARPGSEGGGEQQQQHQCAYRVFAPDLRGHGLTTTEDDDDLSAETLRDDVRALWGALLATMATEAAPTAAAAAAATEAAPPQPPPPSVIVVGHSMGGAIAVWACAAAAAVTPGTTPSTMPGLSGCVVVDVVEGTALAALPHMRAVLAARPRGFASPGEAARWALRSGACRNREAAEVSAPTQVVPFEEARAAAAAAAGNDDHEDDEDRGAGPRSRARPPPPPLPRFVWRTPLGRSSCHWENWYRGLSAAFLERLPAGLPRMLIAAGAERLDRALTVGQMQGKFQLLLVAGSGHAVQEDAPVAVSGALAQLARRFRIGEPPLRVPAPPVPGAGRVLPVVAGPLLMQQPFAGAVGAAARRAPGGTAAAAVASSAGRARIGGGGGGGDGGGAFGTVEEEEEEEEDEGMLLS